MIQLGVVPIFIPIHSSGGGGNMSDHDIKILITIWGILNIWWGLSLLVSLCRYVISRIDTKEKKGINSWYSLEHYNRWDGVLLASVDCTMILLWFVVIVVSLGVWASNLW